MRFIACVLCFAFANAAAETQTFHGWLSDEGCARGRAKGKVFTATNPDCARQCVAKGARIVFIDPNAHAVFDISNQDAARENIGDEVAVTGSLTGSVTLHIDSLKLVARGVSKCSRPPLKR